MDLAAVEYETLSILMAGFTMLQIGKILNVKPHDNPAQTKQYSQKIYGYLAIIGSHTQIVYE